MLKCIESSWNREINSRKIKLNSWKEVFTSKASIQSMFINSGETCKKLNIKGCWTQNLAQPLGKLSKGKDLSTREICQSKLRDGEPIQWRSLMRAELLCQPRGKRSLLRETLSINSKNILRKHRPRWMIGTSGMTRSMGVNMRWRRRNKRMKEKLLKSTTAASVNASHPSSCAGTRSCAISASCTDTFFYGITPSNSTQCETTATTTTTWATSK